MHRVDREGHGGGVALAVRHGIKFRVVSNLKTKVIEHCSIIIRCRGRGVRITSVYMPHYNASFTNDVKLLLNESNDHIIVGDWNAKHPDWPSGIPNKAGKALLDSLMDNASRICYPSYPTYHYHSSGSVATLDFATTNTDIDISKPTVARELHPELPNAAVWLTVNAQPDEQLTSRFDYSRANWPAFKATVHNDCHNLAPPTTTVEINEAMESLQNALLRARDMAIPTKRINANHDTIEADTTAAIREKNRVTRKLQRESDPNARTILRSLIGRARTLIDHLVTRDANNNWEKFTTSIADDPRKFWRIAKTLRGNRTNHFIYRTEPCWRTPQARLTNWHKYSQLPITHSLQNAHRTTKRLSARHAKQLCLRLSSTIENDRGGS